MNSTDSTLKVGYAIEQGYPLVFSDQFKRVVKFVFTNVSLSRNLGEERTGQGWASASGTHCGNVQSLTFNLNNNFTINYKPSFNVLFKPIASTS